MRSIPRLVYLCHAFRSAPTGNAESIRQICRQIAAESVLPLAPQLLFPQFMNEKTDRDRALSYCLRLIGLCDEVRVFGAPTEGMRMEIEEAHRLRIPVVKGDPE